MALVTIAGIRWAVEESLQAAKGQAGLDHYQVRGWTAWHWHITLAMLALAFLAALTAAQPAHTDEYHIPLTLPEVRRLLTALILTPTPTTPISCAGHTGAAAIKPPPDAATTSADPNHDHEVSLEY